MDLVTFICNEFGIKPNQISTCLHGQSFKMQLETLLNESILKTSNSLSINSANQTLELGGLSPLSATQEKAFMGQNALSLAAYFKIKHQIHLKYPHTGVLYGFVQGKQPVAFPLELVFVF